MANRKNRSGDGTENATYLADNASTATSATRQNPLKYVAMMVVIGVVIALAYYAITGWGSKGLSSKQTFSYVLNQSLNQTQALFVNDLKKSENVSNLYIAYYYSNSTEYIKQSSNITIEISSNQTINSYRLGEYNRTDIASVVAYTDKESNAMIAKNVSSVYYYGSNTTVTCFNDTDYSSSSITNSSLQCGTGDQGLSYLEQTPFTAANVSELSYLVFNNTVTYSGTRSIAGRSCDNFIISNETPSNLQENYTVYGFCIDKQYGIPLYFNATEVVGGAPSSFAFTATEVSANVSASELVVPQQYLKAIPHSII